MKTCSYRGAKPQQPNEYLFCVADPEARYGMTSCGYCSICCPKYDMKRRGQSPVEFGPSQRHRFVSGYESILNCPCVGFHLYLYVMNTSNFIIDLVL